MAWYFTVYQDYESTRRIYQMSSARNVWDAACGWGFFLPAVLLWVLGVLPVAGQVADADALCTPRAAQTGNNATLVVPADVVHTKGGFALQPGDSIAAFTPDGLCVGATSWTGENIALTLWGNDGMTQSVDGLQLGEPFSLRIWSHTLGRILDDDQAAIALQLSDERPHYRSASTYTPDAIYVVKRLEVALSHDG